MIGETAELAVILRLKDGLSGGLGKAEGELSRFNASAGRTAGASAGISKGVSGVSKAASGLGGALNHARGELGSLISGPLGLIGLGAGLFSVEHLLSESVGEARSFGSEVAKLTALTGESSQAISSLAGALHHFGIEGDAAIKVAGFYEKNVNKVAGANKSGAASTEKVTKATEGLRLAQVKLAEVEAKRHTGSQLLAAQNRLADAQRKLEAATASGGKATAKFGLNLRDAHGKVVDFSTAILRASAYFNDKLIPASTKASTLAALFGRGYTQLIPLLAAGPKAIKAAMEEAAAAGFTVTAQNVKDLAKLREATRALDTSLGGLKLQIGLALVGPLTEASKAISDFLSHGGTQQITGVVKGAVEVGREVGAAVSSLGPLVKGIADAWNAIPPDFRKLLIGGLVVNKGLKTIFGIDPIDMVRKSVLGVLTGGVKAGVVNIQAGVVNEGGVGGAGGGKLATLLKWGAALGAAAVATDLFIEALKAGKSNIDTAAGLPGKAAGFGATATPAQAASAQAAIAQGKADLGPIGTLRDVLGFLPGTGPATQQLLDATTGFKAASDSLDTASDDLARAARIHATAAARGEGEKLLAQITAERTLRMRELAGAKGQGEHLLPPLDLLHKDFLAQRALLKEGTDAQKAAAAKAIGKDVTKGVGNLKNTKDTLAQLKATRLTVTDPASQRVLDAAIRAVERKIPGREWIGRQLAQGQQIVRSNQTNGQKIAELKQIQQSLISHGDTAAASIVGALLGPVVAAIHGIPTLGVPVPGARGNVSPVNFGPSKSKVFVPRAPGPSSPTHAAGLLGFTMGATDLGIAGEAGREAVAIVKHPRRIKQHGISDYNPYPHLTEQNRDVRQAAYRHQRMVWDAEDRFFKNVPKSTAGPVMFNPNAILDPSQVEFRRGITTFGDRDIPFPGAPNYGGSTRNYYHGQARPRNYYHGQQPLTVNVRTSTSHRDNAGAKSLHGRYGGTKSEVGAA